MSKPPTPEGRPLYSTYVHMMAINKMSISSKKKIKQIKFKKRKI